VFDVEWPRNHPGLEEAVKQAYANGIKLAVSNPCFESWLILHFQNHAAWLDNNQARRHGLPTRQSLFRHAPPPQGS
jgi:RloB-like protein